MKNAIKFIAFLTITTFSLLTVNAQQQTNGANTNVVTKTPEKVGKKIKQELPKKEREPRKGKLKSITKIFGK